jgi:hypothetical protein
MSTTVKICTCTGRARTSHARCFPGEELLSVPQSPWRFEQKVHVSHLITHQHHKSPAEPYQFYTTNEQKVTCAVDLKTKMRHHPRQITKKEEDCQNDQPGRRTSRTRSTPAVSEMTRASQSGLQNPTAAWIVITNWLSSPNYLFDPPPPRKPVGHGSTRGKTSGRR